MTVSLAFPDLAGGLALLVRATLLMAVAWAAAAALRKAGAPAAARHLAWLLGIAALLTLPVLWWLVPALRLPILPAEAATAVATVASSSSTMAAPPLDLAGPVSPDAPADAGWGVMLLLVYALGAATLLLRLALGRRMLTRLWQDSDAVGDAAWERLLAHLSSEMRLRRRVELRIARGPAVPMTWGTLGPKLLLPAEAREWPQERRRLVLLHELAHVARRDSLSRSLASLACALYWIHPGIWFAARQMRMEQEHAADDRVLIAGGSAQAYALSLLHLARGIKAGPRFDQAAAMAGMYQLERRLVSITSPVRRTMPGTVFVSSSALLAAFAALVAAAGVPVRATSTPLGSLPLPRADIAPPLEKRVDFAESGETRGERGGSTSSLEQFAREGAVVSESRAQRAASQAEGIAERGQAHRDGTVSSDGGMTGPAEAAGRDRRPSPAYAEQLRDYGWELPQRDPGVRSGSSATSSRPVPLALPAAFFPDSRERAGGPKWPRNIPRLVRGGGQTRTTVPASQGSLMLSWSVDVGAQ